MKAKKLYSRGYVDVYNFSCFISAPLCGDPTVINMFVCPSDSQSMDDQSWADSKRFLSTVVNNMYASPSAHHYGAFVYGSAVGDHVGLQPFKDKFELQNYFNSMMKPASSGSDVAAGRLCKV